MKKRLAKFVMPIAVILLAVGGAFADQKGGAVADEPGYYWNGTECENSEIICSTDFNQQLCTDGVHNLYKLNGSSCSLQALYIKVP